MRLLLDTNIPLEVMLGQAKEGEWRALLAEGAKHRLFISDFALHSIGSVLFRRRQYGLFREFLTDMIESGVLETVRLESADLASCTGPGETFQLDFDDAYQYVAAKKHDLVLVSFDADFDRTDRGRKTPAQVLEGA